MEPLSILGVAAHAIQLCDLARRVCDIVLVHGQAEGSSSTWSVEYPLQNKDSRIRSDLLNIEQALGSLEARIYSYKYNERGLRKERRQAIASDMIHEHAQVLLRHISRERNSEETRRRPIVFIAHSFGGLIVQQVLKLSKDERHIYLDPPSIYDSTNAILFYLPSGKATDLRRKTSDPIMDGSLNDDLTFLRCPDPDQFPKSSQNWTQQILYECLLPLAQVPLIAIMGSYKWSWNREASPPRDQLGTPSALWPFVRYQLCPLSHQNNTSDCTMLKDVFLDPTPSLFVCASMACAMLSMLYYNRHQRHRFQDHVIGCGLFIGTAIRIWLHKQDGLLKRATFILPAALLVSLVISAAAHSIWDFYSGRTARDKAHERLRAWAKTSQVTETHGREKASPSTFDLQSVH
ncbi:hypothetical protein ONS95_006453 [Cadophora gregata]|uniref:uncharacterized protein n=1 Tax=Cadophora gregata TaxID=51156 RepID=UPI0026DB5908|nr:uncharacterized protein ONS95_006453 [Cadophora gregata]KAK0101274.1 hypothetical protein ONS95_006453 [Cadophora gregata]KAK0106715.1 hypothetical protein ONS96_004333 [Cadophora gregata f. sp. sojae]